MKPAVANEKSTLMDKDEKKLKPMTKKALAGE
jgi:hypothetical protein